jgi:hypothetical protein
MNLAGFNLKEADDVASAGLGDEVNVGGNVWKYVQADGAIAQYAIVGLEATNEAVELTSTISGARPTAVGLAQFAFADNQYGWVLVGPFSVDETGTAFKVLTSAASAVDVIMYTSATAGKVDDGDGSGDKIAGLVLTESGSSGAGTFKCQSVCRMTTNCGV